MEGVKDYPNAFLPFTSVLVLFNNKVSVDYNVNGSIIFGFPLSVLPSKLSEEFVVFTNALFKLGLLL